MTKDFRFYLNFKDKYPNRLEIEQPVKWDAAAFVISSEKGRYALDVEHGNPDISLQFWDTVGRPTDNPLQLPDGSVVRYLTHGFHWLVEFKRKYGVEMDVLLEIELDDTMFSLGQVDAVTAATDWITYFECKIIQNSEKAIFKRELDTKIDLLSDKDINNNVIEPLALTEVLLRAKPIYGKSKWSLPNEKLRQVGYLGDPPDPFPNIPYTEAFNFSVPGADYGIRNTLIPFDPVALQKYKDQVVNLFRIIRAKDDLNNVNVKIRTSFLYLLSPLHPGRITDITYIRGWIFVGPEPYMGSPNVWGGNETYKKMFYEFTVQDAVARRFDVDETVEFTIDNIPADYQVSVFWEEYFQDPYDPPPIDAIIMRNFDIEISAEQTAIDSVIKGVRYIDAIKQSAKSIANIPVEAPRFDSGGEHYLHFIFNGWGTRGFTDKPFYITVKDIATQLQETNADYWHRRDAGLFIGEYPDFYQNIDMGSFTELPSEDFRSSYDPDYLLKLFEYNYRVYEQDKDEQNTIDSVHTERQYRLPSKMVEGQREIALPFCRDPFKIESDRKQSVTAKPNTSLGTDDNINIINVINLQNNLPKTFSRRLAVQVSGNEAVLLNRFEGSEPSFGWSTIGIKVGDTIELVGSGTFIVQEISQGSIKLLANQPINFSTGDAYFTVKYNINGVDFTNETSEYFDSITGLTSGKNFSNLRYTPRRNLIKWEPFLSTCAYYNDKSQVIKNTYIKNNGLLKTSLILNDKFYQENEDLILSEIAPAFLKPDIHDTEFLVDFEREIQLLNDIEEKRGFIRIQKPDGRVIRAHIKSKNYELSTGVNRMTVIERVEEINNTIDKTDNVIYINGTPYNDTQLPSSDFFSIDNEYLKVFDNEGKLMFTPVKFDEVLLNGVKYSEETLFFNTLLEIFS